MVADRDPADPGAERGELYASPAYRAAHPNGEPNTPADAAAHDLAYRHVSATGYEFANARAAYETAHGTTVSYTPTFPGDHCHPSRGGDRHPGP